MALTVSLDDIVASGNSLLAIKPHWQRVRLGDVGQVLNGYAFKAELFTREGGMPLIRIRDVGSAASETFYSGDYDERYVVNAGDLLVGMDGDFNCARWRGPRSLLNQRVCKITVDEALYLPRFLDYVLPGYLKAINDATSSITVKHLSSRTIQDIPLPLPPMEEQREIVAELEKQFSRLDEAVANLQRVKANLKRYKASVLNDAVEGRLVESDSPAALVKLGSVANLIDPQPSHRTPPTHPDGVPYIGIGDVLENGKLDFQNSRKVSPTVLEEHRARYTLRIGDFIFGKIGTLGRPTLLMPPFTYTLSANVVLVQADGVRLLPEYALIFMDSPKLLNMISREAKATTQAAYGIKRMRDLEINLPPVEQQRKIVAEVDRHLSIIREVEAEVDANLQRARALRQSTLSSVFSGG